MVVVLAGGNEGSMCYAGAGAEESQGMGAEILKAGQGTQPFCICQHCLSVRALQI